MSLVLRDCQSIAQYALQHNIISDKTLQKYYVLYRISSCFYFDTAALKEMGYSVLHLGAWLSVCLSFCLSVRIIRSHFAWQLFIVGV